MTDEQARELGLRAMACKGWRWVPGMLTIKGYRITAVDGGMGGVQDDQHYPKTWGLEPHDCREAMDPTDWTPDFRDPATLGCLLGLVREAWGEPLASCSFWHDEPDGWDLTVGDIPILGATYLTEAEALVAALEAAPRA